MPEGAAPRSSIEAAKRRSKPDHVPFVPRQLDGPNLAQGNDAIVAYCARRMVIWRIRGKPKGDTVSRVAKVLLAFGMLVGAYGVALAAPQQYGDWVVTLSGEYQEAYTGNDSGSTFGLFCFNGACEFYVDSNNPCTENAAIPMLINSETGALSVKSKCVHLNVQRGRTRYVYSIMDTDVIDAISNGQAIGFAMPLESGKFKVVRFSLNGARDATGVVGAAMNARSKSRQSEFRDQNL